MAKDLKQFLEQATPPKATKVPDSKYPLFVKGQKVKDQYGHPHTVDFQNGPQVFVDGDSNKWYHPTKIHAIKESEEAMNEGFDKSHKISKGMREWVIHQLEKTNKDHEQILKEFRKLFGDDYIKDFDKIVNEIVGA